MTARACNTSSTALRCSPGGRLLKCSKSSLFTRDSQDRKSNPNAMQRPMSLSKTTSAALLIVAIMTGCSTAGVHQQFAIQPNQGVQIEHAGGFVELREPKIEQVLTNHGMILVTNGTPGALTVKTAFQGGWATQASISLWQGEKMLAMGQAFNGGFGTLLAPGTAANDLVDRAIYTFDQELSKATGTKPGLQVDQTRTYGKR